MDPDATAPPDALAPAESLSARWPLAIAYLVFFLSGAAALVYEISWARQIGLILGHTAHAAAAVLTAYFVGLAAGYAIGARLSGTAHPLRGYAIAEAVAAVWACCVPSLIVATQSSGWLPQLESAVGLGPALVRWLFCFVLLLPATAALGATLPMMADWLSPRSDASRNRIVTAYAINTVGAFCGTLIATIWLLALVGVAASGYVAAGVSLTCAVLALALERLDRSLAGTAKETSSETPSLRASSLSASTQRVDLRSTDDFEREWKTALIPAATSGFGVLALEVLYSRLFSLVFHNSTYTFGAVLAATIVALALGSVLAATAARRWPARTVLPWTAAGGALLVAPSLVVLVLVTQLRYFEFGDGFAEYLTGAFGLVALVVLPPMVLLGAILPLCWCRNDDDWESASSLRDSSLDSTTDRAAGELVGRIAFVNMLAGAAGAAAGSLLLLPIAGLWGAFAFVSMLFMLLAVATAPARRGSIASIFGIALLGAMFAPFLSPLGPEGWVAGSDDEVVRRWDSSYGWIDVTQDRDGVRRVRQNLHYRFGSTGNDVPRALRQARLPLVLHPDPSDVLFLGLGTGLSAGGAVPHREVKRAVVVELIPEVIEAARLLKDANYGVVDDPRFEIVADDARHYLSATDRKFDVIDSDLFVPWESETGYLYTVEHYEHALSRLKPDGLFCQWLAVYQMGATEFEMIADSFKTAFPHTSLWWGNMQPRRPILALIGSREPLQVDEARINARLHDVFTRVPRDEQTATAQRVVDLYMGEWELR
ncbi:MAG TPA: fused MFS/spermidine synthase, partial [Pirellulales bacterium]